MRRLLLCCLFLSSLTACSSTKFLYENADWYLTREYNKNLDLSGARKKLLRSKVDEYFVIHRKQILPEYSNFAREIAIRASKSEWAVEDGQFIITKLEKLGQLTTQPTVRIIADFLLTMTTEEIDRYEENFQEEQKEYVELIQDRTEEQRIRRGSKALARFMKFLAGSQSEAQKKVIIEYLVDWPNSSNMQWANFHERMTLGLLERLRAKASRSDLEIYLANWYVEPEKSRKPQHEASVRRWQKRSHQFLADWFNVMTPKQRRELVRRMNKMAEDFTELSHRD